MGNYYFLAVSLPPLVIRGHPELPFEELRPRLEVNLNREDLKKAQVLLQFNDICNIRSLLMEEPIDPRGNLSEKELDEAMLVHGVLPPYVFEFLEQFDNVNERIKNFTGLVARFFSYEIARQTGFLKRYFIFEREWRLVLAALRAKHLGRDIARELQFEDFDDPLVAQILAQKDAAQYDPPQEYEELKEMILSCSGDPWQEHKAFMEYRFRKIEEMVEGTSFSIDRILAYMAQLMIVESWNEMDEERGKMILDTFKKSTT